MLSLLRNRSVKSLLALVLTGVVLGGLENRASQSGNAFIVQDIIRSALYPLQLGVSKAIIVGRSAVRIARPRYAIIKENNALRQEVERLTRENARLKEAAEENVRLRKMLELRAALPPESVTAEIVSRRESSWFDTAVISKGRAAGVTAGSAVVHFRGLVGQVVETSAYTSQIVALTDPSSSIGALVRRSRSCGIVQGQGGDLLLFSYLPKDADIKPRDVVVSSGLGDLVPKGLVIGRVTRVMRDPVAGATSALVQPSVRFDQIEQVYILKAIQR